MGPEEINLLDDVVVTLENDGALHTWFQKFAGDHLKSGILTAVFARMNMAYAKTRKLKNPDEQRYVLNYLAHRWLGIGNAPMYPLRNLTPLKDEEDEPRIYRTGIPKTIHGLKPQLIVKDDIIAGIDFTQTEERIAAHLSQETTMTTPSKLTFTNRFFLNGVDVSSFDSSKIYEAISAEEARIASLEKIENKPKRLVAEITEAKATLKKLVDHLDAA